jgi:Xaa-Pro aminopeptidase
MQQINRAKDLLDKHKIDMFLFYDEISIYYLTNIKVENAVLCLRENKTTLFVDSRFIEEIDSNESLDVCLYSENNFDNYFHLFKKKLKIGFDGKSVSYFQYKKIISFFENKQGFEIIDIDDFLKDIRVVKTDIEISYLKTSSQLTWKGYQHISSLLKEGVSEKKLADEFYVFCRNNDTEIAFDPIICFAENTSIPHHKPSLKPYKKGDIVLMDLGCIFKGYHSDFTRTVIFQNKDPIINRFYYVVKKALEAGIKACRIGSYIADIDKAIYQVIRKEGLEEYILHASGHGIGLQTHEFIRINKNSNEKIEKNMTLAIEPGLYKAKHCGIRLEEMGRITENGFDNFYKMEGIL